MLSILLIAALAIVPQSNAVIREQCDLIEQNHFFDDSGRLVFTQHIFYDWQPIVGEYMAYDWRLVKVPAQEIRRDWQNGRFVLSWPDGEVLRTVHAAAVRETFTQYDVELFERERLPAEMRRKLKPITKGQR